MKNKIYILHENDEWVEPLRKELNTINAPLAEFLKEELLLLSNIKVVA